MTYFQNFLDTLIFPFTKHSTITSISQQYCMFTAVHCKLYNSYIVVEAGLLAMRMVVLAPFGLPMFGVLAVRADWWTVSTVDWGGMIVDTMKM